MDDPFPGRITLFRREESLNSGAIAGTILQAKGVLMEAVELLTVLRGQYRLVELISKSRTEYIQINGIVLLSLREAEKLASGEATLEKIVFDRSQSPHW